MSEDINIPELREYSGHELLDIIDNQLAVLATIADNSDAEYRTYDDEIVDMNYVKGYAYKLILSVQKKLLKIVKQYEQGNTDNTKV